MDYGHTGNHSATIPNCAGGQPVNATPYQLNHLDDKKHIKQIFFLDHDMACIYNHNLLKKIDQLINILFGGR